MQPQKWVDAEAAKVLLLNGLHGVAWRLCRKPHWETAGKSFLSSRHEQNCTKCVLLMSEVARDVVSSLPQNRMHTDGARDGMDANGGDSRGTAQTCSAVFTSRMHSYPTPFPEWTVIPRLRDVLNSKADLAAVARRHEPAVRDSNFSKTTGHSTNAGSWRRSQAGAPARLSSSDSNAALKSEARAAPRPVPQQLSGV